MPGSAEQIAPSAQLAALSWRRSVGGAQLAALSWRRSVGGAQLAALSWWRSVGGATHELLVVLVGSDRELAGLGRFYDRDGKGQYPRVVVGLDVLGI